MSGPVTKRGFFGLPWGWTLLVFLVVNVVCTLIGVALREGLGVPVPQYAVSGAAGVMSVLLVITLGKRRAERDADRDVAGG